MEKYSFPLKKRTLINVDWIDFKKKYLIKIFQLYMIIQNDFVKI
jgi:hypothetical protein